MKKRFNTKRMQYFILMLLIIVGGTGTVIVTGSLASDSQEVIQLPSKQLTIEKKTPHTVVTNTGDTYAVSKATMIVGMDGKQVKIYDLLVPCEVKLAFQPQANGKRFAQRINIVQISGNATRDMWE